MRWRIRLLYITADETENDDYITCIYMYKCITPTSEMKGIYNTANEAESDDHILHVYVHAYIKPTSEMKCI